MRTRLSSLCKMLFGDSARSFATMSIVMLLVLAIAPAKSYFSEWHGYQNKYLALIKGRGDAVTLQRRFEPGLKQIWIPAMSVTDRCTTCHVAMKEASLADVNQQPFRPHPPVHHSVTQYGCTTCHRGQGLATNVQEAHRSSLAWEQPIIPTRYMEASCGECHLAPSTMLPTLTSGRKLLAREGCVHCHTLTFADGSTLTPTDDPPSLEHIADKTSREWIFAWIKDPQAYAATATMPNFNLKDEDARDISAFMVSQSTPLANQHKTEAPIKAAADPAAGTSLYGEAFCSSCHAVQNAAGIIVGGDLGPELTRVGSKVKPEWLQAWIKDPNGYDPATRMPHFRFNDQQVGTLTEFLMAKNDPDLLANVHLTPATPEQIAHGRKLVQENGCASCHVINGIKKPDNFAPDLSKVGSRSLAQLLFTPGLQHDIPSYISAKIRDPRSFGTALKMPRFKLSTQQVDALTTALLAQTDRADTVSNALRIPAPRPSNYRPSGAAAKLIADLRCFSCHAINGRGGDMAPDLTMEGSAVNRAWLVAFFKNPNTLRPALIRRMPKFNLSDQEANLLSDYILNVYRSPDVADAVAAAQNPAEVEHGKQLFYGKYACQSCHIVDPTKDKGYIGPTLTKVGQRLTPEWIYSYLRNPQAFRPGTLEPNQQINDADARAITMFLSRQVGGGTTK